MPAVPRCVGLPYGKRLNMGQVLPVLCHFTEWIKKCSNSTAISVKGVV